MKVKLTYTNCGWQHGIIHYCPVTVSEREITMHKAAGWEVTARCKWHSTETISFKRKLERP